MGGGGVWRLGDAHVCSRLGGGYRRHGRFGSGFDGALNGKASDGG
jgi:hypothetical protein